MPCSANHTPLKPNLIPFSCFNGRRNYIFSMPAFLARKNLQASLFSDGVTQHGSTLGECDSRQQLALHLCLLFSPDDGNKNIDVHSADTRMPWHTRPAFESAATLADSGSSQPVSLSPSDDTGHLSSSLSPRTCPPSSR